MNKEFLKMQKLAGLITESEYKKLLEDQNIIDRILDKISAQGIESLTPEEKSYLDTGGKSLIPNIGTTEVYTAVPDGELYKIINFPSMPNATNVDFPCSGDAEFCMGIPEFVEMLKNSDFKKIIDKMGSHYKSNWRDEIDQNMFPFHGIDFDGDFSKPLDVVYAQIAGDSYLYFVDTLDRFNTGFKTEEDWGIRDWRKL